MKCIIPASRLFILALMICVSSSTQIRDYPNSRIQTDGQDTINQKSLHALDQQEKSQLLKKVKSWSYSMPYYLPQNWANISENCAQDLSRLKMALENPETLFENNFWALQLMDSWGKFEDGILTGNRKFLGFFDECLAVQIAGEAGNTGRYCLITYGVCEPTCENYIMSHHIKGQTIASAYATCIPSSCTEQELRASVSEVMSKDGLELHEAQCQSKADDVTLDSGEIFGIVFFSLLAVFLIVVSSIDILIAYNKLDTLKKVLLMPYILAFSVPENLSKVFRLHLKRGPSEISCLHGIRFLSITWVVMVHQYSFSSDFSSNAYTGPSQLSSKFLYQIPVLGETAVDTFLFMSGLLLALTIFRGSSKPFSIVNYYVHRIVRIAPPIIMAVLFFATVAGLTVRGPLAPQYKDQVTEACRTFWWLDWTFFSNFIFRFGTSLSVNSGESLSCISQCWYISVDMQLYLIMPLVLLPILRWRKKGLFLLGCWTAVSFLIPALIIGINDLYPSIVLTLNSEKSIEYTYKVYMMPWCRASPYLMGVWTALIICKNTLKRTYIKPVILVVGWSVAATLALFVVFGLYPYNQLSLSNPVDEISLPYSVFYGGFRRGLWGVALAWLVLACHYDYGGFINSFLSYPLFQPLSRLTYSIFLVSLPIQLLMIYSTKRPNYFDHLTKITEISGALFISVIGGLLLTLTSEIPILNLEKLLKQPKKDPLVRVVV